MCILCVASRWSRRIVAMLPWLVIPLIVLWAFSQLLPPAFRFEVTSPRLACLFVILISLGWYEILMPRLSAWRARRIALMRERKRIEALEAAKWRKEATRRCRNCLTAYRDQNPAGGRFMCTYCGHISRRPVLDISNVVPEGISTIQGGIAGSGSELGGRNIRLWDGKGWPSDWSTNSSWLGGSFSGIANYWRDKNSLFLLGILGRFLSCIRWVWRRLCRDASCGEDGVSNVSRKAGSKKVEEGLGSQGSRGEKARRKAEEKRQARLEKEMHEEEERKQREEVARLVEERRRLRDEKLEAEKVSEREAVAERERENRREREAERRRQEKVKEREKGLGKDKSHTDVEEAKKKSCKENDRKYELDKKGETDKKEAHKTATELGKTTESFRAYGETSFRSNDNSVKGGINGLMKVGGSRHLDSVKGSSHTPPKSPPSHLSKEASFWGKGLRAASGFGMRSYKPASSSADKTQILATESPGISTGLQTKQGTSSTWNKMGWPYVWGKGSGITSKDVGQHPSAVDSVGSVRSGGLGGKPTMSGMDRNPGIILSRPPVGVELKSVSTGTTTCKSWHQLFLSSSGSSSEPCSTGVGDQLGQQCQVESGTMSASSVSTSMGSSPVHVYFGSSPHDPPMLPATTSVFSNSVVVSVSAAESKNASGISTSPGSVPDATPSFEYSSYVPDPISLLGPVSESLDKFSLDTGPRHSSETGRSNILSPDWAPIPAPINRPGPIESPVSKLLSSSVVDDVHCPGDQPWGWPSLSLDRGNYASEQGKWQMWETPQLGPCEIGTCLSSDWEKDLMKQTVQPPFKSENHINSIFSQQTTHTIPNQVVDQVISRNSLWLNNPSFGQAVGMWDEHDRHKAPPNFANGVTQEPTGAAYDSVILANGHSYEPSSNSFWSTSQLQDGKVEDNWSAETSGTSSWSTTTKSLTRPNIGGIYATHDVQSVWKYE